MSSFFWTLSLQVFSENALAVGSIMRDFILIWNKKIPTLLFNANELYSGRTIIILEKKIMKELLQ